MMISTAGCFRGAVMEHAIGMTSSGIPQFEAKLQAVEQYDFETKEWNSLEGREDTEITAYLCFFTKEGKPTFHVDAVREVFEWDGQSLAELDSADLAGCGLQFYVEDNEYDGKTRKKVTRIAGYDDAPGTGSVRKLDPEKVREMDAKFANALKKLSGGPKPVSANAAPAPAKPAPLPPKAGKKGKRVTEPDPTPPAAAETTAAKPAPAAEPAAAPKPVSVPKPPSLRPKAPVVAELSYEDAWAKCFGVKAANVSEDQLAAAFMQAVERICPGKDQDDITGAEWGKIADAVIAEYGVFA